MPGPCPGAAPPAEDAGPVGRTAVAPPGPAKPEAPESAMETTSRFGIASSSPAWPGGQLARVENATNTGVHRHLPVELDLPRTSLPLAA